MVRIKPFRAVRPPKEHASEVASRPYAELTSAEAQAEAEAIRAAEAEKAEENPTEE